MMRPDGNGCCTLQRSYLQKCKYKLENKMWTFQAQLEDSGPYMCQLNTDPMKSKMGILNVIIRPDITEVTGSRVVAEGGNVR